jgi:RpiR family transcriptional regulator, carbohydrate utilization regulator
MSQSSNGLFAQIEAARDSLSRSEARVADYVLNSPQAVLELSIEALSKAAGVSEPTVVRFCKSVGFSGWKEFKIQVARNLGGGVPLVHQDVRADDPIGVAAAKVIDRSVGALVSLRDRLDAGVLKSAVALLTRATRIEFYGQGSSGIVALDAQHKFFRLGIPTVAYSDPHVHAMSAALLGRTDVVVAISAGGRTLDLIRSVEIARAAGAQVIGITTGGSPLTRHCTVTLATDIQDDLNIYASMTSRLVHLAIIDILAVLAALERGPEGIRSLEQGKKSLREKRSVA